MSALDFLSVSYLPALGIVTAAGFWFARRRHAKGERVWTKSGLESGIVGSYGLLLSFGFFLSGNVNRDHAALVHDQCEALARLYREADLMSTAGRDAVRSAVRDVLTQEVAVARGDDDARAASEMESARAFDRLWATMTSMTRTEAALPRAALDQAQRAIALEYRLRYNESERAPGAFLALLLAGACLVGFLIGYVSSAEGHGLFVPACYVLLVGGTLVTILDMNDPWHGFLRPSHANYEQLLNAIGR